MKLLAYITEIFIAGFGITQPKPEQQRVAYITIGGFLLAFGVTVLAVMGFLVYEVSAGGHAR